MMKSAILVSTLVLFALNHEGRPAPAPAPPPPALRTATARLNAFAGPRTTGQATLVEHEGAVEMKITAWSEARPTDKMVSMLAPGRCVRGMTLPDKHQELGRIAFDGQGRALFEKKIEGATLRRRGDSILRRRLVIHDHRVLSCGAIVSRRPQPSPGA